MKWKGIESATLSDIATLFFFYLRYLLIFSHALYADNLKLNAKKQQRTYKVPYRLIFFLKVYLLSIYENFAFFMIKEANTMLGAFFDFGQIMAMEY